jgi:hypothetical protein
MSHRRELEPRQFESLCGMQCSVDELCGWFGCDEAALDAWCMEQYGESLTQAFDRLTMAGRIQEIFTMPRSNQRAERRTRLWLWWRA